MTSATTEQVYLELLGERLNRLRRMRGLSREALAEQARVPFSALADQERGQRGARIGDLLRMAMVLDVPLMKLLDTTVPLSNIVGYAVVGEPRTTPREE